MRRLALAFVAAALLLPAGHAAASGESIQLSMQAEPNAGPLFREVPRPVDASLSVEVVPSPSSPTVTPLKVSNVTFPADMSFHPDPKVTPVCPPSKVGPDTNLAQGTAAVVALCPRSVIGTGSSTIYLAQAKAIKLNDPQLVIFNAGRDGHGRPKITIYGFSRSVSSGLLMNGVLAENGELKILVGVLAASSSVADFTLGIPGEPLIVPDDSAPGGERTIKGLDPTYLEAKCSTGTWNATGEFVLGNRDGSTGEPIGEETLLHSNPFTLACSGRKGTPKISLSNARGPRRVKSGTRGTFTVTVANRGTAAAKKVDVRSSGGAHASISRLAPGTSRKLKLKVPVNGRTGQRKRVIFKSFAGGEPGGRVTAQVLVG